MKNSIDMFVFAIKVKSLPIVVVNFDLSEQKSRLAYDGGSSCSIFLMSLIISFIEKYTTFEAVLAKKLSLMYFKTSLNFHRN